MKKNIDFALHVEIIDAVEDESSSNSPEVLFKTYVKQPTDRDPIKIHITKISETSYALAVYSKDHDIVKGRNINLSYMIDDYNNRSEYLPDKAKKMAKKIIVSKIKSIIQKALIDLIEKYINESIWLETDWDYCPNMYTPNDVFYLGNNDLCKIVNYDKLIGPYESSDKVIVEEDDEKSDTTIPADVAFTRYIYNCIKDKLMK